MDKLPVCYGQGISPYCPRCGSGEYLRNEDGNRNDYCGQRGCALDWEQMHNEDTGLTPKQIRELKERDTAKAPEPAPLGMDGMVCPSCGNKALPWDRFCGKCGQKYWEK